MGFLWHVFHILTIAWTYVAVAYLFDRTKVKIKAGRRSKNGLCPEYAVEGWGRRIDWCGRQTPDHKVHIYSNDPLTIHHQDAQLREQGL